MQIQTKSSQIKKALARSIKKQNRKIFFFFAFFIASISSTTIVCIANAQTKESSTTQPSVKYKIETKILKPKIRKALHREIIPRMHFAKKCYQKNLKTDPTISGQMQVEIYKTEGVYLPKGRRTCKMSMRLVQHSNFPKPMIRCMRRLVETMEEIKIPYQKPARVTFSFHPPEAQTKQKNKDK